MSHPTPPRLESFVCMVLLLASTGCSVRGMAVNAVADALAGGQGQVYAADDDPELVRDATPFALKTIETVLEQRPRHVGLLLAATRGFTQYAFAFIDTEALQHVDQDPERYRAERARAKRMFLRARDYGLRALEVRRPGSAEELRTAPDSAVRGFLQADVPLLYWTAAAWGGAISAGPDEPALVADFPAVRALAKRALELQPDYDDGAVHDLMISLEAVPAMMGGSHERAREHFEHSLALSQGLKAGPYVALATGVAVPRQDRDEFESLLASALAIDPDAAPHLRLANLIAQRRARLLLARADYLFIEDDAAGAETEDTAVDGADAETFTEPEPE